MVLPLLQALRLSSKNSKGKRESKAVPPKQRFVLTKASRPSQQSKGHFVAKQLDIFERGADDVADLDDIDEGMVVRPVKVPNAHTLNIRSLAEQVVLDPATFKPGTLLNPTVNTSERHSFTYADQQSDDDDEVPLGLMKFKKISGFEELEIPSEGWSRRAISYDQLYYTVRPKPESDDDSLSDELFIDTGYDLEYHSQRKNRSSNEMRPSVSASRITFSSTKQAKPVHVQLEALTAQSVGPNE
ncbi:unnamed protein product [Umbelopsis vinacea]